MNNKTIDDKFDVEEKILTSKQDELKYMNEIKLECEHLRLLRVYKWDFEDIDMYGATCSNCGTDLTIPYDRYDLFNQFGY